MSLTTKQKRKLLPQTYADEAELRSWLDRAQSRLDGIRMRESADGRRAYLWTVSVGLTGPPMLEAKRAFLAAYFRAILGGALDATVAPAGSPLTALYNALLAGLQRIRTRDLDSAPASTYDGTKEEDQRTGGDHAGKEGPCEEGPCEGPGDVRGSEGEGSGDLRGEGEEGVPRG